MGRVEASTKLHLLGDLLDVRTVVGTGRDNIIVVLLFLVELNQLLGALRPLEECLGNGAVDNAVDLL